ncbi:adenosylmethionine-8-amino-7-oxononanoate aminotransferase [Jatrophihabitans sp. GAS493]|uniref:adenosylmethionine--8-amino-7-oxononanoate transaminase n=1 Tax=Jatrophihabitans sp. GAS493 TaxID=1907575 RepID=UPI000BB8B832|nr:adenosylmethionine--8-amino-7-oxononanoate transaminase [Jatrophihabitans sp. GAS493]SOD71732.1 adenosylmethionine-8-amino-7-oxononanoate aminotransferase [Jatrophihabitans sp. GAS493]
MASAWEQLVRYDSGHVWHPYGPMPARTQPLPVSSARGVRLRQPDGEDLIDGMSSWWAAIHGYRHPELDTAIQEQLGEMAHVMFGGLTHEPGIRLAQRLIEMTPAGLEHVFFADSGSVSVEVAIKLSLQYWQARGRGGKTRLLALRGGYHGDTFGAMSVCDPVGGMHSMFAGVLPKHLFADRPPAGFETPLQPQYLAHLEELVAGHADELAAVIVEPVVQGAGGMHFYNPGYLRVLRELCDEHGVLLILDEIATGFGRSGALFAAEHAGISPDLMCVGKALTGGYLSLAAALCTSEVAAVVSAGEAGGLMHGPTFMANPLACAVALASTDLIQRGGWRRGVPRIEGVLRAQLEPARELPSVADVRVLGAIGVIELHQPVDVPAATVVATRRGVWLRPFRNLVYTMPPYVSTDADVRQIADAAVAVAVAAG